MGSWLDKLNGDPIPWLLEGNDPPLRHMALLHILGRAPDAPEVRAALAAARETGAIAAILAAQHPEGWWEKPGAGYAPKYRGTVWQVIFLDQMGADGSHEGVRKACEYVLSHAQTECGGFGASGDKNDTLPPPSRAIHCLNGNLLRALLGFGWLEDKRVQQSIDWQASSITGEGFQRYYQSAASGPLFACAANEKLPCAWGAVKAMLALARVPLAQRAPCVRRAIEQGAEFLLSRDPALADYPMGWGNKKPSGSWFKSGFPLGYIADVLQNLEALVELGFAQDPRVQPAIRWLLSKQDPQGRWNNQQAYNGKTWVDIDRQGQPSKWVTLRACRVLKAVYP